MTDPISKPSQSISLNTKDFSKIGLILLSLLIFSIFDYLTSEFFYELSLSLMQTYFTDKSFCGLYEHMAFFELTNGKLLIMAVILNFNGVFDLILFVFLTEISIFFSGILKLVYLDPRPFWRDNDLVPCVCATNFGKPSTASIIITVMYLTLTKIMKRKEGENANYSNKLFNNSLLAFGSTIILMTCFSRFAQNVHTINQLLYGFLIGLSVFYIAFYIINADFSVEKNVTFLLKDKIFYSISFIVFSMIGLVNLVHSFIPFEVNPDYLSRILLFCEFRPNDMMDNESYQKTVSLFSFFSVYLAIFIEFKFIFNSDEDKFMKYNLAEKSENETWNTIKYKENGFFTIISRIIIMFFIGFGCEYIFKRMNPDINNFYTSIFFNNICVELFTLFIMIFFGKFICRKLSLTNESIFGKKNELKNLA